MSAEFCEHLGLDKDKINAIIASTKTDGGKRKHDPSYRWEYLKEQDERLTDEIIDLAERYGYKI